MAAGADLRHRTCGRLLQCLPASRPFQGATITIYIAHQPEHSPSQKPTERLAITSPLQKTQNSVGFRDDPRLSEVSGLAGPSAFDFPVLAVCRLYGFCEILHRLQIQRRKHLLRITEIDLAGPCHIVDGLG